MFSRCQSSEVRISLFHVSRDSIRIPPTISATFRVKYAEFVFHPNQPQLISHNPRITKPTPLILNPKLPLHQPFSNSLRYPPVIPKVTGRLRNVCIIRPYAVFMKAMMS